MTFVRHLPRNLAKSPLLTIVISAFILFNFFVEKLRLKRHFNFLNKYKINIRIGKKKIKCRLPDLVIISDVFLVNEYDMLIPDDNTILFDIGANFGPMTIKCSDRSSLVVSIEPMPESFDLLKENIESNGFHNVKAINAAASDYNGTTDFYVEKMNTGASSIFKHSENMNKITVKTVKLDDLIKHLKINISGKKINIKMDVEGSELKVLEGATEVLSGKNISIMMEAHPKILDPMKVVNFLKSYGFEVSVINLSQPFIFARK